MYETIEKCRICGNRELQQVLDLGRQALTGVFPKTLDRTVESVPLDLVKCVENGTAGRCGLVQLKHTSDHEAMYGHDYGYRSGLNQSIVKHLQGKVEKILNTVDLADGDLVIDIGSNDSTLLQAYPKKGPVLLGIDPTGVKFSKHYPSHIRLIPDFFSAKLVHKHLGPRRAKIITSIAMFYDLEDPMAFVSDIKEILANDGVWVLEQSYMPAMLEMTSYDTICHEHLEYYALHQIKWLLDRAGMQVLDIEFNEVNGGSFSVSVAKNGAPYRANSTLVEQVLEKERALGLDTSEPYLKFADRAHLRRTQLLDFFSACRREGKLVLGYGASTKGNVLLQFCGLSSQELPYIADVNEDKFGAYTPGTWIPIVSEDAARRKNPDYFLVLPWHFAESITRREQAFLDGGGKLVFPLPTLQIVGKPTPH
jgi:NDP-4-keto-2,6-dideoxyhexose 3-C-methyltransferase